MDTAPDYSLIRSQRRTISLTVAEDGALVVRAPMRTSVAEIDRFVSAHRDWIAKARARVKARAERIPQLTEAQIELLKEQARVVIPRKVALFAAQMGLAPKGVQITSAKKRFGSCGSNGKLNFSWRLMLYPEAAMDYVVVHELAHLVHFDHSPAFYALIAKYLPDYKARAKLLDGRMPRH